MTVRTDAQQAHERFIAAVLELDLDYCQNDYGVSPCTAGREAVGHAQAVTSNTMTLDLDASAVDDAYNGMVVRTEDGSTLENIIDDYVGATRVATLRTAYTVLPTAADDFTKLLLHMDGSDGSTTFTDSSQAARTVTANGNAQIDTAQSKFGGASGLFDGTGDYLSVPDSDDFAFGSAAFTIDFWVRWNSVATSSFCGQSAGSGNNLKWSFDWSSLGSLSFAFQNPAGTSFSVAVSWTPSPNTWYHIELVRTGNSWMFFINGTQQGATQTQSASVPNVPAALRIGENGEGASYLNGWLDEFRISTGIARHTANFTAPTVAYGPGYMVIDRPNACYNVYLGSSPCQDKANYSKGTKTYKFCTRGMKIPPGEMYRPYIESLSISPTEIDPRGGLARSSRTQIRLVDEPADDHHYDKYAVTRTTAARGTFWSRLIARNPNSIGRWARVRMGYVVDPWNWNTFVSELYVVDSIKGPTGRGEVMVQLKDPIKLADNTKIPAPSDGKLNAAITAGATSLTVDSGKGAQYGSSGFVRIGDEVIQFASRSGDTLNTLTRGQFGTTAAAHGQNDKVQLCKTWSAASITSVIEGLLNDSGITDTYIDTAQMASEDTRWLSTKYQITACISEPEKPSDLIAELVREANAFLWWHPTEQKFKFKVNMPESPTSTPKTLTDTANLIDGSVVVDVLDGERITYSSMHYALLSATSNRSEDKNYLRGAIYIDADAEGPNEYNDRRAEVRRSRFLGTTNDLAVTAFVSRDVSWRREAPVKIKFELDPRDYTISVGELVDLDTKHLTNASGANLTTRVRIMRLVDKGGKIEVEARVTKFRSRYAFIAPNGTPDYPTDKVYAHICRSTPSQTMTNGDEPYLII